MRESVLCLKDGCAAMDADLGPEPVAICTGYATALRRAHQFGSGIERC